MNTKIVFMGTPDFSVPVLKMLIENYNVVGVVTQPDKPVGRSGKMNISPIKQVALDNNIKLFQPVKIKLDYDDILKLEPDVIVTCAYGQIVPQAILDYPKYGCINVHASLLPYHRGGAPIHRAIMEGDLKTGITIMYMDIGMDSGDIIAQKEIDILDSDTAESLFDKLSFLGASFLKEVLPTIIDGTSKRKKQDTKLVTYAYNIKPEDEIIDFNKTKREVFNQVRGLNSWPVAYTYLDGKRLKVWECVISDEEDLKNEPGAITNIYKKGIGVKVQDGEIILTVIQPEGKKKMLASDYLNGINDKKSLLNKRLG